MDNQRLEVGALLQRMWATVEASPSAVASFLVFVSACGFLVDIVLEETSAAGLLNSVVGFVASYFLMRALMGGSGLLPEGETGGFWAYFGVSFVAGLGIGLGFVLLVVPGVILLVRWSPALALVMSKDERARSEGVLEESWGMTRGNFWPIFAAMLLGLIPYIAVVGGFAGLMIIYPLSEPTIDGVAGPVGLAAAHVAGAAYSVFSSALTIAVYWILRGDWDVDEVFA